MIDAELNGRLTAVGPGSAMGELLRRYWHPIAATAEFDGRDAKAVRLLGEDLVVFPDATGRFALIARGCPRDGADLANARRVAGGLCCSGCRWIVDRHGRALPLDAAPAGDGLDGPPGARSRSYAIEEKAGMLFAYLGPAPVPLCPTWEPFTFDNGFRQIVFADTPCNWLQCQENSIDPVHFEWLHSDWSKVLRGERGTYAPAHVRIDFQEFDFGIGYHRLVAGDDERSPNWTTLRLCILPNVFLPLTHLEWRVPVDDTTTLTVVWHYQRVPIESQPFVQASVPYWSAPITDAATGRWITSHVINQDIVAWVGQGAVSDREHEHLGRSDRGIQMLRRQLLADLDALAEGRDPKGVVRDPECNRCIVLPSNHREIMTAPFTVRSFVAGLTVPANGGPVEYFPLLAGQPESIRRAFEEAMGI